MNSIVNVKQKQHNMNALFFTILVFRTFLSDNCYTLFLTLVL